MTNELSFQLIDNSPLAMLVLDVTTENLVYVNPTFRKLFDFEGPLASAEDLLAGIGQEDKIYLQEVYQDLVQGIDNPKVDFGYTSRDNQKQWLRLYPSIIESDGRKVLTATVLIITEEVESHSLKEKYANKKNSVLNILAHDLAGPLSIANTLASSLKNKVPGSLYGQIETITKIIAQSYSLIQDLTNREFLEAVEVRLIKDRIDVVKKIKEYFEEYEQSEQLTKRKFVFNSSSPSIFVELDEAKFIQILNNLTTNALKFTYEGAFISLDILEKESSVLFTFSDNGIGIPDQFKDALFEQFTPARRKGLQGEPSTGMGMWVVKTIVEWHEGSIWFTSKENEGTSFFFEIPKH